MAALLLAGCGLAPSTSRPGLPAASVVPSASEPPAAASAGIPTAPIVPSASATSASADPTPYVTQTVFTSPLYRYAVTLPAGWLVIAASEPWDGTADAGHADPIVDQLYGPLVAGRCTKVLLCGPNAWAYATRTTMTLGEWDLDRNKADTMGHPCALKPETTAKIVVSGEPAILESKHCAPVDGILVMKALTVRSGVAFAFYLQDPADDRGAEPADRSDFSHLLATIHLP